jgi:putative selenate reductase
MSDRFRPISMEQFTDWALTELEREGSLFGVPRSAFFVPRAGDRFRAAAFGVEIDTPFGVAAGPHTQMAQNIVAAWLTGARLIELKTVQTLDRLGPARVRTGPRRRPRVRSSSSSTGSAASPAAAAST